MERMWVTFLLASLLTGCCYSSGTKHSYEGDKVVLIKSTEARQALQDLFDQGELEKWGGNVTHMQVHVPKDTVSRTFHALISNNVIFDVLSENFQEDLDAQNVAPKITQRNQFLQHKMDWMSYHKLGDIYDYMDYLAETYPDIASVGTAGKTVEGRDLKYLKISSGARNAKSFWIDGGIHAREWLAPAAAAYVINELVTNRKAYTNIVNKVDFYVMPVMNPDGYVYTHTNKRMWRKNRNKHRNGCVGTDLNRNWGFHWGESGVSSDPCDFQIYAGSKAFSEPETQAVSRLILSLKPNLTAYVSFHTYGQYILVPYGFDNVSKPSDFNELLRVAKNAQTAMSAVAGENYQVGHTHSLVGTAAGTSEDWAKGVANIKYSYTFELRPRSHILGFALPARFIKVASQEALAAVMAVAKEL